MAHSKRVSLHTSCDTADAPDDVVVEVSEDAARCRRELCIGSGAHTHYWDAAAGAIGEELDLLVEEASTR